jgi:hypothetical protein
MALGMRCEHCGWFESYHNDKSISNHCEIAHFGYKYSLKTCPGFKYRSEDIKDGLEIIVLPDD